MIFLFFFIKLFGLSLEEKYLISNLFFELFNKPIIKVYSPKIRIDNINHIKEVKCCKNADIVLGFDKNCSKPQFVLNYYIYKNYKKNENIIGAFYWRKGRPQIRLRKKILLKYHLRITNDMKDFLE